MAGTMRVCQFCKAKGEMAEMVYEKKGKANKFWHKSCYSKAQEDKAFKEREAAELDSLITTIKNMHDLIHVPNKFYPFIQDLRNGTIRFKGKPVKKYKDGVPYCVIEEAYQIAARDIQWAKKNKNFKSDKDGDSTFAELKYGLAIVQSKLNLALLRQRKRSRLEAEQKKANDTAEVMAPAVVGITDKPTPVFKKQKSKKDISAFLND